MKKHYRIISIGTIVLTALFHGCNKFTSDNEAIICRTDTKPINSRFVGLGNPTNICWIGESLTKNSRFSVPGKSAVRVRCFVQKISETCSKINEGDDWEETPIPTDMPNSSFGDLFQNKWEVSENFNMYIFPFKYKGTAYYCRKMDLLYFDVWWE